jgi:RepB DNA-primase from phage plasmid/CHC2 zinc finger
MVGLAPSPRRQSPDSASGLAPAEGLDRYLAILYGEPPPRSLVEVRFRTASGMGHTFHRGTDLAGVAATILRRGQRSDVYVGVLARRRRGGGRDAVVPDARVLWTDCDTPEAIVALARFTPPPSLVVLSGSAANRHAYWLLSEPYAIEAIEEANHLLALTLGADASCAEAARILRPPSSRNWKHDPPGAVRLAYCDPAARYTLADIAASFPPTIVRPFQRRGSARQQRFTSDPLLAVAPAIYVERLLGCTVPRHRKVRCPFHDDADASLHVYRRAAQGWYCYGCHRGGSVYDLGSLLYAIPARGPQFLELKARLAEALSISLDS